MVKHLHRETKKMSPGATKHQGFTLIEVLVAGLLLILLINTAYGLLYNGVTSYRLVSEERDVLAQLRIGLNRMERELREARWLTTNTDVSTLKFRLPNHMSDKDLTIPLTYSRDKIITYYVNNGKLLRIIYDIPGIGFDGATPNRGDPTRHYNEGVNEIARNIASLKLTYHPLEQMDHSYQTAVTITLTAQGTSKPLVLTSTVRLRAQEGW